MEFNFNIANDKIQEVDDVEDIEIIAKTKEDILNEIKFKDEDDRLMCDAVITGLEKYAAECIKDMKIVNIPHIGNIRINPVKRKLRQSYATFRAARKNMNKEQYKDYIREYIHNAADDVKEKDRLRTINYKIIKHNHKKYEELYKKLGKSYANMFVLAMRSFAEVSYSQEFEDRYNELKD